MYTIENNIWNASFDSKGAELRSLFHKSTAQELMWQADPTFWSKTSPILFPIVGALKDDTYTYGGAYYTLSRHGFARDCNFEIIRKEDNFIEFLLRNNDDTLSVYPFVFELKVRYELSANGLTCTYQVNNSSGESPLFFSLGGHPAFAIKVNQSIKYSDYHLIFPKDDSVAIHRLRNNLVIEKIESLKLEENKLLLSYPLFYEDALVITNLKSQNLILGNSRYNEHISFKFQGFPYFGLWAAKNANFICLEPWAGIADYENHDQQLVNKKGIVELAPRGTWEANWRVDLIHSTNESYSFTTGI